MKTFDVADGRVVIELLNEDTEKLEPGEYLWDLRLMTNPEYTQAGAVIAGENSTVLSVFSGGKLPKMIVTEVTADV